jgi:epoxide hydrolase-like protein
VKRATKLACAVKWGTFSSPVYIHFVHIRSKHENALPLIVTHGCPGSIIEQMKIIDPLTNPAAHGGSASDAFHLMIPSMPGYGFSSKPTTTGWGCTRMARAWPDFRSAFTWRMCENSCSGNLHTYNQRVRSTRLFAK